MTTLINVSSKLIKGRKWGFFNLLSNNFEKKVHVEFDLEHDENPNLETEVFINYDTVSLVTNSSSIEYELSDEEEKAVVDFIVNFYRK